MEQAAEPVGAIAASLVFAVVVLKLLDFLKYLFNAEWNSLLTLLLGWAAGAGAVWLMLQTQWADEVKIGNETLQDLTFWSKAVLGFAAASLAAVIYDFKKAVDDSDSAATSKLLGKTGMGKEAEELRVARVESVVTKSQR